MPTKTSRKSGFTLVEILIVLAIIGLLGAITIPNLNKVHEANRRDICINHLQQIAFAKDAFACYNHKTGTDLVAPTDIFGPDKYLPHEPTCPAGGKYTIGAVGANPACSIPEHALPTPATRSGPIQIDQNCTFITADEPVNNKLFGEKMRLFETTHPNLRIIDSQIVTRNYKNFGAFFWHEPKTNAIALEQPTPR